MNKKQGGFIGLVLAILAILGIWSPSPVPPQPTPTPTPEATPTPAPSILPTPELPWLCKLPASTGTCVYPPVIAEQFRHAVEEAQAMVPNEFYDVDGKVKDEHRYVLEVVRWLRVAGYCAIQNPTVVDEVGLKNENAFKKSFTR